VPLVFLRTQCTDALTYWVPKRRFEKQFKLNAIKLADCNLKEWLDTN
jgi:hypothetical protein